jgi:diguanylate cyclase (GGDEF)-like protein
VRKVVVGLIVPEGPLVLLAAALVGWPGPLPSLSGAAQFLAPLVFGAGVLLAWRFGRGSVLAAVVAIAGASWALEWAHAATTVGRGGGALAPALALLLPLDLAALALLPERGVFTPATLRRLAALAAQAAVLIVLARPGEAGALGPLTAKRWTAGWLPAAAPLGDAALVIGLAAILILAVALLRAPAPLHRGFLWAVVAMLLAFALPPDRRLGALSAATFLLTVAALSLAVAILELAHALAYRDGLTGLPNRRALDEALRRLAGPFAVAMVDVDHFKSFNDTHGHAVGDQVLRMVATQLDAGAAGGQAYRYGGEEFAMLFPGRAAEDIRPALEAVREAVAGATFTLRAADRPRRRPKRPRRRSGATQIGVTISIGVAQRSGGEGDPEPVVKAADQALYRAKEGGRNRVVTLVRSGSAC